MSVAAVSKGVGVEAQLYCDGAARVLPAQKRQRFNSTLHTNNLRMTRTNTPTRAQPTTAVMRVQHT